MADRWVASPAVSSLSSLQPPAPTAGLTPAHATPVQFRVPPVATGTDGPRADPARGLLAASASLPVLPALPAVGLGAGGSASSSSGGGGGGFGPRWLAPSGPLQRLDPAVPAPVKTRRVATFSAFDD
jgi:hypothetical protein